MVKTGDAEHERRVVELDVAASLARSTSSKNQTGSFDALSSSSDAEVALEAQLEALFRAQTDAQDESRLVAAFLAAARASQRLLTLNLLANTDVAYFPNLLQFLLRVMIAVHARTHAQYPMQEQPELISCSYAQNTAVSCISYEQEESSTGSFSTSVQFKLPEGFHACVAAHYGSVKRLKCEEVWHGDHMAYRCRTCGLSDSSCMCLACFDPEEHEGHDYRVYRCSSGGCCDCGDPLAWKPEGFCKKHSAKGHKTSQKKCHAQQMTMGSEENAIVYLLVQSAMAFCVNVLKEVHAVCLNPHVHRNQEALHPRNFLPRTGLERSEFPLIVKTHVDRLKQIFLWLQTLSMSCLSYRTMISNLFFTEVPIEWELDATSPLWSSSHFVVATSDENDGTRRTFTPLVTLDVFLKAGILLPVEACDVLGVLYLKLLFDQAFKQKFTCHFVEWYPYWIELYLCASDENKEEGMRNLSRFIDRLFCQLFHSNAQLRELEASFASLRPISDTRPANETCQRRRRQSLNVTTGMVDSMPSSCVEWLMVFLLEKLNELFRSTLRLVTILPQPLLGTPRSVVEGTIESTTLTKGSETIPPAPLVVQTIQAVDCGRNVFKKRIYARLCSDLRTLLVHSQLSAEVLLRSFRRIENDKVVLYEASVYAQLLKTFELLQQMDLQTRQIHQHIEFESQKWTFAFVADYEVKLLLSAFLMGVPACFTADVWRNITSNKKGGNEGIHAVIMGKIPLNPMETATFRPLALARSILQPVRVALTQWAVRNGRAKFGLEVIESVATSSMYTEVARLTTMAQLVKHYEQGTAANGSASSESLHFPLHHLFAALIHALCGVVRPKTIDDWRELLGMGISEENKSQDFVFWYDVLDHPLRVLLFSREIKAGLWVRNGAVMLQQLIHYHSKHWRFFGLHSDLFLCQLGAIFLPHGNFTRRFFHKLPIGIFESSVLTLNSMSDARTDSSENGVVNEANCSRLVRQELDLVEEALRLFLQLVLAPVRLALTSYPETAAVWLLEREIMHWLTLGPFTRSELLVRIDMKLVEQVKQLSTHEWAELEEEEILTHVLERVGVYDDPVGNSSGPRTARSNSPSGYGPKMSGSWKLKPELWAQVSSLFECFTPSEAQQCEQNVRKLRGEHAIFLPLLPRQQLKDAKGVDMHRLVAETMLNSSYMASVWFIIMENYWCNVHDSSKGSARQDSNSIASSENLLLAALHCLYVAIEMSPKDSRDVPLKADKRNDVVGSKRTLDDIAPYFDEESTLFHKLCTKIPVEDCRVKGRKIGDGKKASINLLSLLVSLHGQPSATEDIQAVTKLILDSIREKSVLCLQDLDSIKRRQLETRGVDLLTREKDLDSSSCDHDDNNGNGRDDLKLLAKEMMRKRQQQILDKLRSQQMQFLSENTEAVECEANECARTGHEFVDSDYESYDDEMEFDDDLEEEHEEEDEWGFPTGQIDVFLYLNHVSSAISQMQEKHPRAHDRKRRRKRSTRSSSISVENDNWNHLFWMIHDDKSLDEAGEQIVECGLCRLPCDDHAQDSSFGYVGMILPTAMISKIAKGSSSVTKSDVNSVASSRLPSLCVLQPETSGEMRFQLADSVIWSCGHAIHHACLKAYLISLWKQKHGRSPLEMANSEDRLLCERDTEFLCPICRRLSNCLVPRVSFGEARDRALTSESSLKEFDPNEEEEEEKEDDEQQPLTFLPWLESQMSFQDELRINKRRRSRTQSNLRVRRRLLSTASMSSMSPGAQSSDGSLLSPRGHENTVQDGSVEREIGAFCQEIVLRCVRAQLHLPTLLTSSMQDEASVDLEIQQLSSEFGAQTPAWQLLLHCFEVQLRVVAREKTLWQTDTLDPLQLRSMRQLVKLITAAVAFSTPSSVAWTAVEAPIDKHFDSVMTRLNGLIFGQQVLFNDDDEVWLEKWNLHDQLRLEESEDTSDAAIVGTPMLYHPSLLTCFTMRMMWRLSIATANANVAVEQLLTEAFFLARVVFTAQVLQTLMYLLVQNELLNKNDKGQEVQDASSVKLRDFDQVESLRDAAAWISHLLARARILDNSGTIQERTWNTMAIEEQVSALCLPLAQQMLLLMDVILPVPHDRDNSHEENGADSPAVASESCAVCDGLFVATLASSKPPTASKLLDKCLRRLHLPPLRLFFHRQMFPSSQRALCQLWGAQLEAKAAVSRQQARSQTLVMSTDVVAFPLRRQVRLLSCQISGTRNNRLFIPLPRVYMDLFIQYNDKPKGVCNQCAQIPQHPGLCLFCGQVLCCFSACCEVKVGGGMGECTQHAQRCCLGTGAFLLLRACTVILFLGNERRCVWGSLYVDKNGEEDPYLRRGKTLYLDQSRRLALETLLVSHSFSLNTAILQNTSRRDGRRY